MLLVKNQLKRKKIINSFITNESYKTIVEAIMNLGQQKTSSYVCIANIHMLIEAYQDEGFNGILNQADIATPDGKPVAIAMQWLYKCKQERVAGMDLIYDLMEAAEKNRLSVFFWVQLLKFWKRWYKGLQNITLN